MNRSKVEDERPAGRQVWISPAEAAVRLGVSRSQVARLAARHGWQKLDVSTSPHARNAGVRYALSAILSFERANSY